MHEPCGDFDNPGSNYERYADSYKPDWRRDQDTQANAYVRSQEKTLNDFIQSAQAFQQRSQANIQANIQANEQGWQQQDQMWQQQDERMEASIRRMEGHFEIIAEAMQSMVHEESSTNPEKENATTIPSNGENVETEVGHELSNDFPCVSREQIEN